MDGGPQCFPSPEIALQDFVIRSAGAQALQLSRQRGCRRDRKRIHPEVPVASDLHEPPFLEVTQMLRDRNLPQIKKSLQVLYAKRAMEQQIGHPIANGVREAGVNDHRVHATEYRSRAVAARCKTIESVQPPGGAGQALAR